MGPLTSRKGKKMKFEGSDILSVQQFDRADIDRIFSLARQLSDVAKKKVKCNLLNGGILGNLFYEPSTRTRMSFASAFIRLGGQVNSSTGMANSSLVKGETLADTITMIQSYCDVLVIRHPDLGAAAEAAKYSDVPVINAGDGTGEHPTQALQDLFTIIEERPSLKGMRVALVGDLKYGRCPHSLIRLLSLYEGVNFVLVAPEDLRMPQKFVNEIIDKGFGVEQISDFREGISGADVIYMTRIQDERISDHADLDKVRSEYVLNREILHSVCKPNVSVLHPLPRTTELSVDMDGLPNSVYFRQAENSMLIRMALLLLVLGRSSSLEG